MKPLAFSLSLLGNKPQAVVKFSKELLGLGHGALQGSTGHRKHQPHLAVPDRVEGQRVQLFSFVVQVNINPQVLLRVVGRVEGAHTAAWHTQATHDCSTDRQNTGSQNPSAWRASSHLTPLPTQAPLEQVIRTLSR